MAQEAFPQTTSTATSITGLILYSAHTLAILFLLEYKRSQPTALGWVHATDF